MNASLFSVDAAATFVVFTRRQFGINPMIRNRIAKEMKAFRNQLMVTISILDPGTDIEPRPSGMAEQRGTLTIAGTPATVVSEGETASEPPQRSAVAA